MERQAQLSSNNVKEALSTPTKLWGNFARGRDRITRSLLIVSGLALASITLSGCAPETKAMEPPPPPTTTPLAFPELEEMEGTVIGVSVSSFEPTPTPTTTPTARPTQRPTSTTEPRRPSGIAQAPAPRNTGGDAGCEGQKVQATYYHPSLQGGIMRWGGIYNRWDPSIAAYNNAPGGTKLEVTTRTSPPKSIVVTVRDTGHIGANVDLSEAAFELLAPKSMGRIPVCVKVLGR